jgi:hypothetical protein
MYVYLFVFQDRVSLYSPGFPETHSADQAGLELRNLPASASQVLGLKACATTAWLSVIFCHNKILGKCVRNFVLFQVRTACSCALGYLTYNAHAFRLLLTECRNKPNQFLRITNNISKDAKINPAFLKEFQLQQRMGLPSLRYYAFMALLDINGRRGP